MAKILIVEDEEDILDLVEFNLHKSGMETVRATDGLQALKAAKKEKPDLILLDVMLPEKDGYSVLKELREKGKTKDIPVIMLTAKGREDDRIRGLDLGAEDYVTKPFSPKELVLRVRALLRRAEGSRRPDEVREGAFRLNRATLKVYLEEAPVDLTVTEFRLLLILIEGGGEVQERGSLLERVGATASASTPGPSTRTSNV